MGHHSVHNHPKKGKRTRKKRNTKTLPKTQILHSRICRFFHFIHFFLIPFFKVIYHGLCIIVFRNIHKKGKEQEKKDRPKPPQKFKFHIPGYVVFFIYFFFLSNLSWIMHHSVDNHPKKGKRTRKKRNTKTLPKIQILHSRICRFVHFIHFFKFLFLK